MAAEEEDVSAGPSRLVKRQRYLEDEEQVFSHNAWDDVEWDEEQEKKAVAAVQSNSKNPVKEEDREMYEKEAASFWDKFYGKHQNKFFKDRNWLRTEFPALYDINVGQDEKYQVLEVGCGVGNTVFPFLQSCTDPRLFVHACDFSSTAVDIVKAHADYDEKRCRAFVCDVSEQEFPEDIRENTLDVAVMIFVLSAIETSKFSRVVAKIFKALKPGGLFLFRDYGRYDLAQLRFKDGHLLADNFYVRGDGTRVYFFTQDEIKELMEGAGFVVEESNVDRRLIVNRMRQLKMYRVWLQGNYRKPALKKEGQ